MAFVSTNITIPTNTANLQAKSKVCRFQIKAMANPNQQPNNQASPNDNPNSKQNTSKSQSSSPESMLLADLEQMRSKRKRVKTNSSSSLTDNQNDIGFNIKSAIETVLLWDFFLVLALLSWLVIALIPHFVAKNDVLLDPWLALWQPFIQPVLGVLMLGTIVQGTISYISSK